MRGLNLEAESEGTATDSDDEAVEDADDAIVNGVDDDEAVEDADDAIVNGVDDDETAAGDAENATNATSEDATDAEASAEVEAIRL